MNGPTQRPRTMDVVLIRPTYRAGKMIDANTRLTLPHADACELISCNKAVEAPPALLPDAPEMTDPRAGDPPAPAAPTAPTTRKDRP